jgi:hypothetical protein
LVPISVMGLLSKSQKPTSQHLSVKKTVFSIKVCHHLSVLQFWVLVHWAPFRAKSPTYPLPPTPCVALATASELCSQTRPIWVKTAGPHCIRNKNADLGSTPCACCAHEPAHPSAEVNFALPRQFCSCVFDCDSSGLQSLISNRYARKNNSLFFYHRFKGWSSNETTRKN